MLIVKLIKFITQTFIKYFDEAELHGVKKQLLKNLLRV